MMSASSPRREMGVALAVTAVTVAAVVVVMGLAGAIPGFPAMPGAGVGTSTGGAGLISYAAARALASAVANPPPMTGYLPVMAVGYALAVDGTLVPPNVASGLNGTLVPPPAYGSSNGTTSPCTWTGPSGSALAPVAIPAVPSNEQGRGLANVWTFGFAHGSSIELVLVAEGHASVYAVNDVGSNCAPYGAEYLPLASDVIDSPQAAGVALAWGGSALLANDTAGTSTLYSLVAPFLLPMPVLPPGSATNGSAPPVNTTPVRFGSAGDTWDIAMTGCSVGVLAGIGTLFAMVNASSGALQGEGGFQSELPGSCPMNAATYGWPFWFGPIPVGISSPPSPVPPAPIVAGA